MLGQIDSTNASNYHLADGLGSARGLAREADYAAFGELRARTGQASAFGYTGEETDASGLTHLRARQYDPGLGRFLSADTVQPNAPGTQGYNRYAYVANNPTTWTDPSGHVAADVAVLQRQMPRPIGMVARLAPAIMQLALVSPGVASLVAVIVVVRILELTAVLLLLVGVALVIGPEPWQCLLDGTLPESPPALLDPWAVWEATTQFPPTPGDCLGGAVSEVVEEHAWTLIVDPLGPLDLVVTAATRPLDL